ncbi:MAG: hypothetical protein WCS73_03820 [Lentisphaeria bacterium]
MIKLTKFNNDKMPFCEIKTYKGKPTVFINGNAMFPMAYISYCPENKYYRQMAQHGVHVYSLSLTLTNKWINRSKKQVKHKTREIWRGVDDLDFDVIDESIKKILDEDPNAWIFPRIYCDSLDWWDKLHPKEVFCERENGSLRPSFSSKIWREATGDVLKKIVCHVASMNYGDRIIGYHIGAGETEEFGGTNDYSYCAEQRFKEWLLEKDTNIEYKDSISIPSIEDQKKSDLGIFLDPIKSHLTIAYRQFYSEEVADSAIALCGAVKEACGGKLLTGIFYGYTCIWGHQGHLALRRVLNAPEIDFISNAHSRLRKREAVGNDDIYSYTAFSSIQKAGKLFYAEADIRTCLSRFVSETNPEMDPDGEYDQDGWLGPDNISDSWELLKAVFARFLVTGTVNWWFDLWGGWYNNEKLLELFSEAQRLGSINIQNDRESICQIALIVDEASFLYHPYGTVGSWIMKQMEELGKMGAPYDIYLLDDIPNVDLSQYRLMVFANAFVLSDYQRQNIEKYCQKDKRVLFWLYAPGIIKDNSLSLDNISNFLGMELGMEKSRAASTINITLSNKSFSFEGLPVDPFIYIKNSPGRVYGKTAENHIVIAEKIINGCPNIFVAIPPAPVELLRYYAEKAGVFFYCETGNVVFASKNYLAIASPSANSLDISIPHKSFIEEVLVSHEEVNEKLKSSKHFKLNFAANSCRIFKILSPIENP